MTSNTDKTGVGARPFLEGSADTYDSRPNCISYTLSSLLVNNLVWINIALIVTPVVIVIVNPQIVAKPTQALGLVFYLLVGCNLILCSTWLFRLSPKPRCACMKRLLFHHYHPIWTSEEADPESYKSCLFGYHPHGALPFACGSSLLTPILENSCLMTSSALCAVPIYRFILLFAGGIQNVNAKNVKSRLQDGQKTMIVVGGVREMHLAKPFRRDIGMYVGHKGFIRLAIQHGRNLAAVINFEENDMLAACCPACERMCYSKCKQEGLPFWRNWFGMPVSNRLRVHLAISKVIRVQQEDDPSVETIDRVHREYFQEVQALFEAKKQAFGHGDRKLVFYDHADMEIVYSEGYVEPWMHVPQQWPPLGNTSFIASSMPQSDAPSRVASSRRSRLLSGSLSRQTSFGHGLGDEGDEEP